MKKGQAAIEFLITYGWAIMAAISVIGALAYFGLTNPSSSLPDKCLFSNAFECKDYYITSNVVRVKLSNSAGQGIYSYINTTNSLHNISVYQTDNSTARCAIWTPAAGAGANNNISTLEPDGTVEVICTNMVGTPFTQGDKIKVRLSAYYANKPSGYMQVSLGEIYATVQ